MSHTLAPFLLPEGYARPRLSALLHERRVVEEAGRAVVRRGVGLVRRPVGGGDADPILLVPGFLAGDWTLVGLAERLRREGFRTYRSSIHANVSCTINAAAIVESRLESIVARRGQRVQIVGHSLGGMIARGLVVRRPDLVAGVVTMGSPMAAPAAHHGLLTSGVRLLNRMSEAGIPGVMSADCVAGRCAHLSFSESREPLRGNVAMTNIYSRRDGIVDWRACIDRQGTAVEVLASHIGMAFDPRVGDEVVSALLAQRGGGSLEATG
ncbi:esterase/lipase family protein [Nocardioides montaniterrae]